eukprot:Clim_evm124s149 gene=Clim_evmTU124s149
MSKSGAVYTTVQFSPHSDTEFIVGDSEIRLYDIVRNRGVETAGRSSLWNVSVSRDSAMRARQGQSTVRQRPISGMRGTRSTPSSAGMENIGTGSEGKSGKDGQGHKSDTVDSARSIGASADQDGSLADVRLVHTSSALPQLSCLDWCRVKTYAHAIAAGQLNGKITVLQLPTSSTSTAQQGTRGSGSGPNDSRGIGGTRDSFGSGVGESDIRIELTPPHRRSCSAIQWAPVGTGCVVAAGLDKYRNEASLVIWDIEVAGSASGSDPNVSISSAATDGSTQVTSLLSQEGTSKLSRDPRSVVKDVSDLKDDASSDALVRSNAMITSLWQVSVQGHKQNLYRKPITEMAAGESVVSFAWFPSSMYKLAAGMAGRYIRVYDLRDPSGAITVNTKAVNGLTMDPHHEHRLASYAMGDSVVKIWDLRNLTAPIQQFNTGHRIRALSYSSSKDSRGQLATLGEDATTPRIWDLNYFYSTPTTGPTDSQIPNSTVFVESDDPSTHPMQNSTFAEATVTRRWTTRMPPFAPASMAWTSSGAVLVLSREGRLCDLKVAPRVSMAWNADTRLSTYFGRLRTMEVDKLGIEDLANDIGAIMNTRSRKGYGASAATNAILMNEQSPVLSELWSWIARLPNLEAAAANLIRMIITDEPDDHRSEYETLEQTRKRQSERLIFGGPVSCLLRDENIAAAATELKLPVNPKVRELNSRRSSDAGNHSRRTGSIGGSELSKDLNFTVYTSPQRSLVLRMIGWDLCSDVSLYNTEDFLDINDGTEITSVRSTDTGTGGKDRILSNRGDLSGHEQTASPSTQTKGTDPLRSGTVPRPHPADFVANTRTKSHEQAAALAIWQSDINYAIQVLKEADARTGDQQHMFSIMAIALAGYSASTSDSSHSNMWITNAKTISREIEDPYIRGAFSFLTCEDAKFADVLEDDNIHLADRIGIAVRFLDDRKLALWMFKEQAKYIKAGNLTGLMLTGWAQEGIDLMQQYMDQTSDVQTVALLAMQWRDQAWLESIQVRTWMDMYRELLNRWTLFLDRAKLDVAVGATNRHSPQLLVRCSFCGKSVAAEAYTAPPLKATNAGGATNVSGGAGDQSAGVVTGMSPPSEDGMLVGSAGAYTPMSIRASQTAGSAGIGGSGTKIFPEGGHPRRCTHTKLSSCPHCHKPLPRCCICLLHMSAFSTKASLGFHNPQLAFESDLDQWFTWCQNCRHGGHLSHIIEWFDRHTICPVSGCKCQCGSLDTV